MPAPTNLKVLPQGVNIIPVMNTIRLSLGVRCDFCHTLPNYASDDNPHKATARMMITMVNEINAKFPDGKEHVTCYTCHRGSNKPETMVPAAGGPGGGGPGGGRPGGTGAAPGGPPQQ